MPPPPLSASATRMFVILLIPPACLVLTTLVLVSDAFSRLLLIPSVAVLALATLACIGWVVYVARRQGGFSLQGFVTDIRQFGNTRVAPSSSSREGEPLLSTEELHAMALASIQAALNSQPHPKDPALQSEDCLVCLEELGDDENAELRINYDGQSLGLRVMQAPLSQCRTCRKVFHASCLCQTLMAGILRGSKRPPTCPACMSYLVALPQAKEAEGVV